MAIVSLGILIVSIFIWALFFLIVYNIVKNITGEKLIGIVVGQKKEYDEGPEYFPILEYKTNGVKHQFQSTVSNRKPFNVGEQLRLVRNTNSGAVERYNLNNLLFGAICVLFLAIMFTGGRFVLFFSNI